ncbi:MAG: sulfatase-like hydrolase/transferase, partial [Amaricoccus sp.]
RVVQAVDDMGELDDTLVIYIGGDNGPSVEGMLNGTLNRALGLGDGHVLQMSEAGPQSRST